MGGLGPWEIVLIFLAILLLFGAKRIPEIARGLGKGIREFKSATREITNEITSVKNDVTRIDPPHQQPISHSSSQPQSQGQSRESTFQPD